MSGELREQTVLVTGGGGFIGSHLVDALVEDNDVRVLDDFSTGDRDRIPSDATLYEGDVRESDLLERAMADVDVVFHTAAKTSVSLSVERPLATDAVNSTATVRLLEAARDAGARVVYSSSSAIYGPPESVPIAEDARKRPNSPYGVQKLASDQYVRAYHDLYGLETVALRYFNVYGPRQPAGDYSGVIGVFLEQARGGEPLTVHGDGSQTRDFVHVDDVVRANLAAATTEHTGEAFNVGTGESVTIRELAATVRDVTGSDSDIEHEPPRTGDVDHSRADVTEARRRLNYAPTVSLERGLAALASEERLPAVER